MSGERKIGVGCSEIDERSKQYVNEVLDTGRLSYGSFTRRLESAFASLHGSRFAMFCSSGTGALRGAVACLKEVDHWQPKDEIILPAVTFVATSNVVIDHGLEPVFCDVERHNYNIDPNLIEKLVTDRTRAIMPVHLMGLPCDMDPIMEIAERYSLRVIEDSCETMFVSYRDRPVGCFGDIACFSTYMGHLLPTGVGGFALTSSPEIAMILKSLFNHGRDNVYLSIDDDEDKTGSELQAVVERRFRFVRPGYSLRATEMEAALGLAQLEKWKQILTKRTENADYLNQGLAGVSNYLQLPSTPDGFQHAHMTYGITVKEEFSETLPKAEFTLFLEEHGIETRDILPLINQPFYVERYGNLEARFPVARWVNNNGFYVGCHQRLARADLDTIIDTIKKYIKRKGLL